MNESETFEYIKHTLGIDLQATNFEIDQAKVDYVVGQFPFKGILLSTGANHLTKAGIISQGLLRAGKIHGSIERFESWELAEVSSSIDLLLYTNLSDDLLKPQSVILSISNCVKLDIPMIITTPLLADDLDKSLPMSVISNLIPYLFGHL